MRVQHIMKQPILRQHVELLDTFRLLPVSLRLLFASAQRTPADFPQVVVVEDVGEKTPAPDHEADFHRVQLAGPVGRRLGAVSAHPAAYAEAVEEVPRARADEDEGVDGRHAGLEVGEDQRAVDVVRDVQAGHGEVAPGEGGEGFFLGDAEDAVQDCERADGFHHRPGGFAGEVEARVDGGFALRVEVCEPLEGGELG